ncbi:hypothetical protein NE237_025925 [Protea cynaroides]|uniref:Uncharacterized protein n=1 Tax=Protea cynaroides TaxID=273540 RepID=A0A9Q0H414_9MAGN|nr:hypothetical protein NE237_025925 [Protea cynaroides]
MDHVTHTERGHSNSKDLELINPATDTVSAVIESIQKGLKKVPSLPSNCSIYRVPKRLRKMNPEAFRPCLVSIGPLHWYVEELQPNEALKLRHLNDILERESRVTLCDYVKAMAELENRTRECYSEIIQLNSEEFVKMMLLDGCFILEHILKCKRGSKHHPIFNAPWMASISYDLFLLENQLPFFVLERLFYLLNTYGRVSSFAFTKHVHWYYSNYLDVPRTTIIKSSRLQLWRRKKKDDVDQSRDKIIEIWKDSEGNCKAKHLLDFIRLALLSSSSTMPKNTKVLTGFRRAALFSSSSTMPENSEVLTGFRRAALFSSSSTMPENSEVLTGFRRAALFSSSSTMPENSEVLTGFRRAALFSSSSTMPENSEVPTGIRSATELHEAGVKFEKGPTTSLLDITFSNGVLKIPTLEIEDSTESLFRNLIAYEQCLDINSNEITTYADFIDGLINSPKDVELLQRKGIVVNRLGDPEDVSALFNSLLKEVIVGRRSYLSSVCIEVEKYYKIPRHKWKANLMHNYFNTPWAFISVFAAVVLLILTGIQTICSIIAI